MSTPPSTGGSSICTSGPGATANAADNELETDWSQPVILVVDDDVMVQELSADILRDSGFRVFVADGADGAIEILKSEPEIRLLFTDVVMPGSMNGFALADWARSARPEIGILYTSGYSWTASETYGGRLHGELVKKPFRAAELQAAVANALKSQQN